MHTRKTSRNHFWLLLSLIMLVAFGVRLWTVGHGLPHIQVTDENSDLSTALRLIEGEIPERHVRYHRSLIAYINVASIGALFSESMISGQTDNIDDFRNLYFSDRAAFTLATRLTFTLLTTLTIGLVALTGRYLSEFIGLLAAALLTANSFFMLNSAFAMPDTLIMFATSLCLWLSVRLYMKHRRLDYFLAGMSIAIVMLSKFSALPIAICTIIAHIGVASSQSPKNWLKVILDRRLLWLVAGVILGNLILNPIAFLHPDDLIFEIQNLANHAYGSGTLTLSDRLMIVGDHISDAIKLGWRWMLPASILGIIAAFHYKKSIPYWIILIAFVTLFMTIANVVNVYYKYFYWTPWLIPMSLLSGIGLSWLVEVLKPLRLQIVAYLVITGILVLETHYMLSVASKMVAPDTRELALEYIQTNYPANTRIISGVPVVYAVPLIRNDVSIERARTLGATDLASWDWWLSLDEAERPGPAYDLYGPEMRAQVDSFEDIYALIRDQDIQLVIESDYCWGSQNRPGSYAAEEYPALNSDLRSNLDLVMEFSPYGIGCEAIIELRTGLALGDLAALDMQTGVGPVIRIYRPITP